MKKSIYGTALNWKTPTVKQVNDILLKASKKLDCEVKHLHFHFHVSKRSFFDYRKGVRVDPTRLSAIRYPMWALLVAVATGKIIMNENQQPFEVKNKDAFEEIIPDFIFKSFEYQKPPENIINHFFGDYSISGLSRADFAQRLSFSRDWMYKTSKKMSFPLWTLLLVSYGVKIDNFFKPNAPEILESIEQMEEKEFKQQEKIKLKKSKKQ